MTELTQIAQSLIGPAAIAPITDKAFLRITGPDATRWLNGMVTNNIKDLAPGQGNYNFLLNAQGRIQADCTIFREPHEGEPTFLLETDNSQLETIHQLLDKFIIMDDVELHPTELTGIRILGPQSFSIVTALDDKRQQNPVHNIRSVVQAARQEGHAPQKAMIAPVQPWLVEAAKSLGLDIEGYKHVIDGSAVRHVINRHGNEQIEVSRGQLPVRDADLDRIPEVIDSPDIVLLGTLTKGLKDQIGFVKRLDDGTTLYLEEVRRGRKQLATVSMRRYPATKDFDAIADTLPSNARGDGGTKAIIIHPPSPTPTDKKLTFQQIVHSGAPVSLVHTLSLLIPHVELWADPSTIASIVAKLTSTQPVLVSPETLEALRILSATPKYGIDIRNTDTHKDLPQETAQTHALNFNKGCYLGQEIVERIHSRGQVHRTFTQFTLTPGGGSNDLPILPAPLTSNEKPAGELTSAARIGDKIFALGYIRREVLDIHQPVTYPGGTALPIR